MPKMAAVSTTKNYPEPKTGNWPHATSRSKAFPTGPGLAANGTQAMCAACYLSTCGVWIENMPSRIKISTVQRLVPVTLADKPTLSRTPHIPRKHRRRHWKIDPLWTRQGVARRGWGSFARGTCDFSKAASKYVESSSSNGSGGRITAAAAAAAGNRPQQPKEGTHTTKRGVMFGRKEYTHDKGRRCDVRQKRVHTRQRKV